MARLRGLGRFLLVTAGALLVLRVLHLAVPLFFPEARPGPFAVASLGEVERHLGFVPLVPAYWPERLGEGPSSLTVARVPQPTFVMVWEGADHLSIAQRRGGAVPAHPPASRPLAGVAGATWWEEAGRHRVILKRGELWIEFETDLPLRDLTRMVDTLHPY